MSDFFNNTTSDHHDHEIDIADNDRNDSTFVSIHDDQEHSQRKEEKEPKDMNRIIQNSIAPLLIGFAVSMMFIFGLPSNASGFDRVDRTNDLLRIDSIENLDLDKLNYERIARPDRDEQLNRLNIDRDVNDADRNLARRDGISFIGLEDGIYRNIQDASAARLNIARINDGDGNRLIISDRQNLLRDGDYRIVKSDEDGADIRDNNRDGLVRAGNAEEANIRNISRTDLAA